MKKEKICENMIDYCAARKKDGSSANVVSPPVDDQGRIITFNVYRFLNVLFSDKFKPRFATHGRALMKEDYDSGVTPDQTLFTEFLEAYNDRENAAYGLRAHKELPQVKSPADFDNIDTSHWLKVKEKFKALFKLYEEFIIACTTSGTHSSREECEDVTEDQLKKCSNLAVKYMYYFLKAKSNHDLLAIATGSLPNNVFRQSGSNAHRRGEQCTNSEHGGAGRAGRGRPKGARSGGGGRDGDSSAAAQKDRSTSSAFESIATRNDVMTHAELVKLEKYYNAEITTEKKNKHQLITDFAKDCCGENKAVASDRIKAAKLRKMDEDDDAESVTSETQSEEYIQSVFRCKDRIKMLENEYEKTKDRVKQYNL